MKKGPTKFKDAAWLGKSKLIKHKSIFRSIKEHVSMETSTHKGGRREREQSKLRIFFLERRNSHVQTHIHTDRNDYYLYLLIDLLLKM